MAGEILAEQLQFLDSSFPVFEFRVCPVRAPPSSSGCGDATEIVNEAGAASEQMVGGVLVGVTGNVELQRERDTKLII